MYYCKQLTKVVSSLGTLTLCLDNKKLDDTSTGYVLSNPPYFFETVRKGDPCPLRVSLLLYPFDLCLYPVNKPVTIVYKENGKDEELTLTP